MTGKFLISSADEMQKFKTLLKLAHGEEELLERLASRKEPIVFDIRRNRYIGFMPLDSIPKSTYEDIRKWADKMKEWRHLV